MKNFLHLYTNSTPSLHFLHFLHFLSLLVSPYLSLKSTHQQFLQLKLHHQKWFFFETKRLSSFLLISVGGDSIAERVYNWVSPKKKKTGFYCTKAKGRCGSLRSLHPNSTKWARITKWVSSTKWVRSIIEIHTKPTLHQQTHL